MPIYYACKYAPVELMAGFGVSALPVTTEEQNAAALEDLIHPAICGFAKNVLGACRSKEIRALVLTTCCDAMNRVGDVLQQEGSLDFLYVLDLPHVQTDAAYKRYEKELMRFAKALSAYTQSEFSLAHALAASENTREKAKSTDYGAVLKGAHAMPSLLELAKKTLQCDVQNATCSGDRVLELPDESLYHNPSRACEAQKEDDLARFVSWYAKALLTQPACMRMAEPRKPHAADTKKPVLYHTLRFCEYWPFEYRELTKSDTASLLKIETEATSNSSKQLVVRLKAFQESLEASSGTHPGKEHSMHTRYAIGIDIGSTASKGVLIDRKTNEICARAIRATGAKAKDASHALLQELEAALPKGEDAVICATGYGRDTLQDTAKIVTEITCHAKGARALLPDVRCVIDIGGQDSKAIALDECGNIESFVMNDKCAAGTGRFLDTTSRVLELDRESFIKAGLSSKHPATISSMCTVFAESEIVTLIAQNTPISDIVSGLSVSVAQKTASLVSRVHGHAPFLFTGGVSKNMSVVEALEKKLDAKVATSPDSQFCGALGAALLA